MLVPAYTYTGCVVLRMLFYYYFMFLYLGVLYLMPFLRLGNSAWAGSLGVKFLSREFYGFCWDFFQGGEEL